MKIDLGHALYVIGVVLFAFIGAIVVTKTISRFFKLDEEIESQEDEA